MPWHSLSAEKVLQKLGSSRKGLSWEEARKRLDRFGRNEIVLKHRVSPAKIFVSQFTSPLVIILIVAAIGSYAIGFVPGQESRVLDSALILIIVLANGIFGFFQEYNAEKSIEALKKLSPEKATVLRNGEKGVIDARELVPGDIILLSQGDKVPADARLVEARSLQADESLLTGESIPISKGEKAVEAKAALHERKNMVFKDTVITRGKAVAIVVGTGLNTELGKIAESIHAVPPKMTPFQIELERLGKKLGIAILLIIVFIAVVQFLAHEANLVSIFLTAIALAVAAIPEGLPAIVTLSLAFGTKKMLSRNALVRKLAVVESLGSVDVICTDKTGTLTENRMTVTKIFANNQEISVEGTGLSLEGRFTLGKITLEPKELSMLLKCGVLCNDAAISTETGNGNAIAFVGDPTEIALLVSARKAGLGEKRLRSTYPRIDEIPFSSERKKMTTLHKHDGMFIAFTKGAPEVVLENCSHVFENGKIFALSQKKKKEILHANKKFAANALRVLAFAFREFNAKPKKAEMEQNLVFLGLQAMIDPPRKEVKQSISICREAGVRVIMLTGDNLETAKAIAEQLGLGKKAMLGSGVETMNEFQLRKTVEETDIFARVSPVHKQKILAALKDNGHIVAMTGDGVNDAPALKASDVGIAMGLRGTDVARETSDMILLDDNFKTIQEAIAQGRTIFENIRKFVNYLLSANSAEVLTVFFVSLAGYLPITAVQLLWINLLTDGFPALALGVDPAVPGTMKKKPRPKGEGVINTRLAYLIIAIGSLLTILIVALFFIALKQGGIIVAQTMVFTGLIMLEFVRIAMIRSQEQLGFFSNKWLVIAISFSLLAQFFVLNQPLAKFFNVKTVWEIPAMLWGILFLFVAIAWVLSQAITKYIVSITPQQES